MCTVDSCCLQSNRLLHRTSILFPYSLYCSPLSIFSFPLVLFIILHSSVQLSSLREVLPHYLLSSPSFSSLLLWLVFIGRVLTAFHCFDLFLFTSSSPLICSSPVSRCALLALNSFTAFSLRHPFPLITLTSHSFFPHRLTLASSSLAGNICFLIGLGRINPLGNKRKWKGERAEDRTRSFRFFIFPLREKMSLLLSPQGRDRVDISSSGVEIHSFGLFKYQACWHLHRMGQPCVFLCADIFFSHVCAQWAPCPSILIVPYVVMLLERKCMEPFLCMHVFVSQFAMHHDARPSVSARWLNSLPICCRVMRKQTRAAFHTSELKHKHNLTPAPQWKRRKKKKKHRQSASMMPSPAHHCEDARRDFHYLRCWFDLSSSFHACRLTLHSGWLMATRPAKGVSNATEEAVVQQRVCSE